MASTPPRQIISPQTPLTPLHGAAYERPTRQSSRIKQRVTSQAQAAAQTPRHRRSITPQVTKTSRRVQVASPTSPNTQPTPYQPSSSSQPRPTSTTFAQGMLPTPVKTPKKKADSDIRGASAALFQDPFTIEEMAAATPRKNRKAKRYNGFSLESFRVDDDEPQVQVFTDNCDKIPEVDDSPSNPFYEATTVNEGSRATKRRKVSNNNSKDSQVEDAIRRDDGMVYVFRGKKVFRRFNDAGDDDEEIDPGDLGLLSHLNHIGDPVKRTRPLRTLTRKSIKPKRLFESEEDKAAREREKEEEIMTDVEERTSEEEGSGKEISKTTASLKSRKDSVKATEKKTSPFDKWPRLKNGSREGPTGKAVKRSASAALDGSPAEAGHEITNSSKRKTRA